MSDEKYLQQLGKRIRENRVEKNLSQDKLAAMCEMEKANLSRIETGKTNTTILTLRKISKALVVKLSDLLVD